MVGEQLSIFEPTGDQVLALVAKYEKDRNKALQMAQVWSDLGCAATAGRLLHAGLQYDQWASEMRMLAEFEALGGVA